MMKLLLSENTNTYVISDIHGCFKTLRKLIEDIISINKDDYVFFLGDYIDKGPSSKDVLDYIILLKENNYRIYTLMGNHEKFMLDAYNEYDEKTFILYVEKICKSGNLLDENKKMNPKYLNFFKNLELYYEINNKIFLVHAGINFLKTNPFEDINTILTGKTVFDDLSLNDKIVIHGHFITEFQDIVNAIEKSEKIIPLDNGCYLNKPHRYYDYQKHGNLFCLNLRNFNYYFQKNVD